MHRFLGLLSLVALALALSSCRLECIGEGPVTFDSIALVPQSTQVKAGGDPIMVRVEAQYHCGGFDSRSWSLEPKLGTIEELENYRADPYEHAAMYRPPAAVEATAEVKIIYRMNQKTLAESTITVFKP